ncbi:immediate early response 3-interacting protein 1-like [Tigriopus californicus]|uniref:immediate early response 3-interacting protein 1-like n=1 Tax=Tigriopus californicus TaxID=6832 RepID=UPI0027DA04EB|nr:immediate early response 3-interacting protein 1-like [Tigriopus californicus]
MAFTLWALIEAGLLVVNAICILHEQRFLAKIGWANDVNSRGFGEQPGVKAQLLNIIHSTRTVMRIPLIFINSVVIVWKLILG